MLMPSAIAILRSHPRVIVNAEAAADNREQGIRTRQSNNQRKNSKPSQPDDKVAPAHPQQLNLSKRRLTADLCTRARRPYTPLWIHTGTLLCRMDPAFRSPFNIGPTLAVLVDSLVLVWLASVYLVGLARTTSFIFRIGSTHSCSIMERPLSMLEPDPCAGVVEEEEEEEEE